MKTGVVLELNNGKATLMTSGGEFLTVTAQSEWRTGDVVSVRTEIRSARRWRGLSAIAACFLVLISLSAGGALLWNDTASLISLDVNPSIELEVNRFDRVIAAKAYNPEAQAILDSGKIGGQPLDRAISELFANGLTDYLEKSPYIAYSVQSGSEEKESSLSARLKALTEELTSAVPSSRPASIDIYSVDDEVVTTAHQHHVTAGKYMAILQLQEVNPEVQVEEYSHCSIGEIHREYRHCSGFRQDVSPDGGSTQPVSQPLESTDNCDSRYLSPGAAGNGEGGGHRHHGEHH